MASDLDLTEALDAARTASCSHVWDLMLTSPCLECRLAAAAPHIEAAVRKAVLQETARGLNGTAKAYSGRYRQEKWDRGFVSGVEHAAAMVANSIDRPEVLTEAIPEAPPMSPDLPAALPPSLVEAAAIALQRDWSGAHWTEDSWTKSLPDNREAYLRKARVALAAALAECEVREEWIAEVDLGYGFQPRPWVYASEAGVDAYLLAIVKPKRKLRRLAITTVASPVDTPGEEQQ